MSQAKYRTRRPGDEAIWTEEHSRPSVDVFMFRWSVPQSGFRWQEETVSPDGRAGKKKEWMLTDGNPVGLPFMRRVYSPLRDHPALFKSFAELPVSDRDVMLAFANQHGDLGLSGGFLSIPCATAPNGKATATGETHQAWAEEVSQMSQAVRIWDLIQAGDRAGLSRYMKWKPEKLRANRKPASSSCWGYDSHPDLPRDEIRFPGRRFQAIPREDLERWGADPNDIRFVALKLLQGWVNKKLEKSAAPRLLYHLEMGTMVIQVVPDSLLAAMWLQLAHAVAANKVYRTCRECGGWFEVASATDARTARRVFCSDPCKSKDYRRRKEETPPVKGRKKTTR